MGAWASTESTLTRSNSGTPTIAPSCNPHLNSEKGPEVQPSQLQNLEPLPDVVSNVGGQDPGIFAPPPKPSNSFEIEVLPPSALENTLRYMSYGLLPPSAAASAKPSRQPELEEPL